MGAVPERPVMPSDTDAVLRSIRRWVLVVAFLLGVGVVALADAGYVVSGYQDGVVFGAAGVAGGTVALVAGLWVLSDLLSRRGGGDGPTE